MTITITSLLSSRSRLTCLQGDWSSDVSSPDLGFATADVALLAEHVLLGEQGDVRGREAMIEVGDRQRDLAFGGGAEIGRAPCRGRERIVAEREEVEKKSEGICNPDAHS